MTNLHLRTQPSAADRVEQWQLAAILADAKAELEAITTAKIGRPITSTPRPSLAGTGIVRLDFKSNTPALRRVNDAFAERVKALRHLSLTAVAQELRASKRTVVKTCQLYGIKLGGRVGGFKRRDVRQPCGGRGA